MMHSILPQDIKKPSLVQHFAIPSFWRAAMNKSCLGLVRNSDKVIPMPLSFVLLNQRLSQTVTLTNLRRMGLGFSLKEAGLKLPSMPSLKISCCEVLDIEVTCNRFWSDDSNILMFSRTTRKMLLASKTINDTMQGQHFSSPLEILDDIVIMPSKISDSASTCCWSS